jgi:hypothetical protein
MKRVILAAAALLALSTTSAHAVYRCQPSYVQTYDNYYHTFIIVRGRDVCSYYPDPVPQQPYYEPPYYPPQAGYPPPQAGYYEGYVGDDAGAALVGGLIGFGLGYVVGENNNNNNNYYYYKRNHKKHYKYPGGWNNGQGRPQPKKNRPQPNNN